MAEGVSKVWRVTEPFAFDGPDGRGWLMRAGDLIDETHPAFKRPGSKPYLEEVVPGAGATQHDRTFTPGVNTAVETATAAPGERRSVTAPARKG